MFTFCDTVFKTVHTFPLYFIRTHHIIRYKHFSIYTDISLQSCKIPTAQTFHLLDYRFSDFVLDDDDTIKACIRMFLDLELLERFHINYEVRPFVYDDNVRKILLKSRKYESFSIYI